MQEFIIIDGLPYLYADGKAYAVRWDDEGFTLGDVFCKDISPDDFIMLSELSAKAQCQGRLDSIGKTPDSDADKPKRGKKKKGETE